MSPCTPVSSVSEPIIVEDAVQNRCENASPPTNAATLPNRPPNSSAKIAFGTFHHSKPISITVTLTPFTNGIAHPAQVMSVVVSLDPGNPFPHGVPPSNGNLTIALGSGTSSYRQGVPLQIHWEDRPSRGPCVDLYLVQSDGSGGTRYLSQVGDTCFEREASGSFTWVPPHEYVGSGYRIFGITPGGASSGMSPVFSIEGSTGSAVR